MGCWNEENYVPKEKENNIEDDNDNITEVSQETDQNQFTQSVTPKTGFDKEDALSNTTFAEDLEGNDAKTDIFQPEKVNLKVQSKENHTKDTVVIEYDVNNDEEGDSFEGWDESEAEYRKVDKAEEINTLEKAYESEINANNISSPSENIGYMGVSDTSIKISEDNAK